MCVGGNPYNLRPQLKPLLSVWQTNHAYPTFKHINQSINSSNCYQLIRRLPQFLPDLLTMILHHEAPQCVVDETILQEARSGGEKPLSAIYEYEAQDDTI